MFCLLSPIAPNYVGGASAGSSGSGSVLGPYMPRYSGGTASVPAETSPSGSLFDLFGLFGLLATPAPNYVTAPASSDGESPVTDPQSDGEVPALEAAPT